MTGQGNKNFNREAKPSNPALLQTVDVFSNDNDKRSVSLLGGTVRVLYWESILGDSIKASVVFTDAGNTLTSRKSGQGHGNRKRKVSAVEGLPITTQEEVSLKFTDNYGNTLDFDKTLVVNGCTNIATKSETTSKNYELELRSQEFLDNDKVRVEYPSADKISEQVKDILKNVLESEKVTDENFEETENALQYTGKNRKPFYIINDLSRKSISQKYKKTSKSTKKNVSAGYLFWETSEGYHFKSLDGLLKEKYKKKIIYNETPSSAGKGIPEGYDLKALTLEVKNTINAQKKFNRGAWTTRNISFDPFSNLASVTILDAYSEENQLELAGERLPVPNKAFVKEGPDNNYTRTTWQMISTGQLHMGKIEEQIEKSKLENFKSGEVVNQAIMRYNQLFSYQITITVPGEFSLHAGDTVFMDIPEISESENKSCADEVNKEDGGLYIIADLCHYITAKETYTKLNLVRDSFGRTGSSTGG